MYAVVAYVGTEIMDERGPLDYQRAKRYLKQWRKRFGWLVKLKRV